MSAFRYPPVMKDVIPNVRIIIKKTLSKVHGYLLPFIRITGCNWCKKDAFVEHKSKVLEKVPQLAHLNESAHIIYSLKPYIT